MGAARGRSRGWRDIDFPGTRLRVAVVERAPDVREAIHALVERVAYVVGAFGTMHELATCRDEPADVIFAGFHCCLGPASEGGRAVRVR
jgi:hypothetical protein